MAKSEFDQTLDEAVAVRREFDALPRRPKLTSAAWLVQAMTQAGADMDRLQRIDEMLNRPGTETLRALIDVLIKQVCWANTYGEPPQDATKLCRIYGRESALAEMAVLGIMPEEIFALASKNAKERGPEHFGDVPDMDRHQMHVDKLRATLDQHYERLRDTFSARNLTLEFDQLTERERGRGLVRAVFKRAPEVSLTPDWPEDLVRVMAVRAIQREQKKAERAARAKRKPIKRRALKDAGHPAAQATA